MLRTPFHFCLRPSWPLLKIRYTTLNDSLHLLDMRKNNGKTSMTFHDKLACNANRYRMQRRCRAKKFLGKATSLKKLLSPPINLLLSVWYMYGPGKKCMDEIWSEFGNHVCISHINVVYIYIHICIVSGSEFISELAATCVPKSCPKSTIHIYIYIFFVCIYIYNYMYTHC